MSAQSNIWPFSMFAPNNLNQAINPGWFDVNINYEGNPAIEKDVVENVASFGKQLGIITEAVLELAQGRPDGDDKDPITRLRRIAAKVEELKQGRKNKLLSEARDAMDRLAKSSPASAEYVAQSYIPKPSS